MKPRPPSKARLCLGCRRPLAPSTVFVRVRWRRPLCEDCLTAALAQVRDWPRPSRQAVADALSHLQEMAG